MKVNSVENMWIRIEANKKLLVLGVVYRHPVRAVEHLVSSLVFGNFSEFVGLRK